MACGYDSDDILSQALDMAENAWHKTYMADETQKAPKSIETDYDSDSVLSQVLESYEESEGEKIFITQSTYRDVPDDDKENILSILGHAVDVSDMLEDGGASGIGAQRPQPQVKRSLDGDEIKVETGRFKTVDKRTLSQMTKQQVPDNTRRKAQWVVNLYNQWATEVTNSGTDQEIADMLSTDLLHQSYHNLNIILCNFVLSLRRKDGNEYTSGTLFSIITSMQKYFEIHGRPVSFLNDPNFNELKNCLDNSMQKVTKEGYGLQKRQANVITKNQENELWERGILGIDEPEKLLHSMFWTVGVNFGLRGGDEHRNLTRENFRVMVDQDGKKYLEYKESISKTYKGGLKHRKTEPHQARAYEIPDSPRCTVQMFVLYTSKLNPASSKSAFYFQPLSKPSEEVWFALEPVGHNKLKEVVKSIMPKGGYDGYFTNHSLRATTATRLFEQKVPEQLIMEQTGHRSTAIYSYKRPSDAQKRDVSQALQATTSKSSYDNNNIINGNNNCITNNNNTKNNEGRRHKGVSYS